MFLKSLYFTLKWICRFSLYLFFEKVTIIGKNFFNLKRPTIVVANHPNTLIDPLVICMNIPQQNHFLANAGLFANPITDWLFRKLWCIPIKRRQDHVQHISNDDSFHQCDIFLSQGGCLFVAPEGSSFQERHLREIKTGTARIALSAEAKNNFQLGLQIQPIGVSYTKKGFFRSNYVLEANTPIIVADFEALYQKDSEAAVDAITETISKKLATVIINTEDEQQDQLLVKCEQLILGEDIYNGEKNFRISQQILEKLQQIKSKTASEYVFLEQKVNAYFEILKENEIHDAALIQKTNFLYVLLGIPFFLLGYLLNVVPYFIVKLIWKKFTPDGYDATIQFAAGLIFFPICYIFEKNVILLFFSHITFFTLLFFAIAIIFGIFALYFFPYSKNYFSLVFCKNKEILLSKRKEILIFLNEVVFN